MESRKRVRIDYKELSSAEEMTIDIEHLSQIPTQTSLWENEHVTALNIEYINVRDINEIIQPSDLTEEDNFKNLILKDWKKDEFLLSNDYFKNNKDIKDKKMLTVLKKIRRVLGQEVFGHHIKETQVDSFMTSLLYYLGFDDDPLLIHPQYDYSVYIDKGRHKITSKVEFMITKDDAYVVLIVEDKHLKNVIDNNNWSEPQIAGEIFGAAFYNKSLITQQPVRYPFDIYAIRVIGTKITFYKSTINRDYLVEVETKLPINHKLVIQRFPQQLDPLPNQDMKLPALDFANENDRIVILSILKSLYKNNN
ncbi:hypothetical protein BJ944DRAFT_265886 [Cunninghamella echinulata]|nr:hypothetical protein BJ944DRAFT_265886 [Cunninghamella echinulata]